MDDVPLDDSPASAVRDATGVATTAPATAAESLGAVGSLGTAHDDDLWGAKSTGSIAVSSTHSTSFDAFSFDSVETAALSAPPPSGSSATAPANPFDGFDDFAAPLSGGLSLPPPAPFENHSSSVVSLGSPLISFSPVAGVPAPVDAPVPVTSNAVHDLLSFSPVATAPPSSSSSSFLTIDDFFLSSGSVTAASTSAVSHNSSNGIDAFDRTETSTVQAGPSALLPQTELLAVPGFNMVETTEESSQESVEIVDTIEKPSSLESSSHPSLLSQTEPLAVPAPQAPEILEQSTRWSVSEVDVIETSVVQTESSSSPTSLLPQNEPPAVSASETFEMAKEATPVSFNQFDVVESSMAQEEPLSPLSLEPQTQRVVAHISETFGMTEAVGSESFTTSDAVVDLDAPLPAPAIFDDEAEPITANAIELVVGDFQLVDSDVQKVEVEVQMAGTSAWAPTITTEAGEEGSPELVLPGDASEGGISVQSTPGAVSHNLATDATEVYHTSESHFTTLSLAMGVQDDAGEAIVGVLNDESKPISGYSSSDSDKVQGEFVQAHTESFSGPDDLAGYAQYAQSIGKRCGVLHSEVDNVEEEASDASLSPPAIISQPVADQEHDVERNQESQAEVGSPSQFSTSEGSFRALSNEFAEVDDAEDDFDAEVHTVYAQVNDDDESASPNRAQSPASAVQLPISELDNHPGTDAALSPSSVVSSPGSSVSGSAFAFIAAGASSAFSFGQPVDSPREGDTLDREVQCEASDYTSESVEETPFPTSSGELSHELDDSPVVVVEEHTSSESTELEKQDAGVFSVATGYGDFDTESPGFQVAARETTTEQVESVRRSFSVNTSSHDFGGFEEDFESNETTGTVSLNPEVPTATFGFETFLPRTEIAGPADDDGFGGFGQSADNTVGDEDDDFGDFGTASSWGGGGATIGTGGSDDDDDFGDFTPASASQQWDTVVTSPAASPAWTPTADPPIPVPAPTDMNLFFGAAFPGSKAPYAASLLPKPASFHSGSTSTMSSLSVLEQPSALHKSFHNSLQDYRSLLTGDNEDSHHYHHQPPFESEAVRLKYLKYVLTEKLNEASRHDGVFPQGSEQYRLYEAIVESGHEKNMREALKKLQEALFHSSVNEAVMRIARQAALSAKARIAEQAAQQQANARGSLLATTRNFLSRSGAGSNEKDQSSRTGSGSLGVLTPTGASVHKISRFSSNGQEGDGHSSGYGSGEDTGSDISVGDSSNFSESDLGVGVSPLTSSSSGQSGGLMKKFRLSFSSSSKNKQRTVSLRRMGQSNEEVCKMELNMESISGGFDEVKWRCAGFLYETEEVARLAPSQIKIYSYPGNQLLTGKTDRSALSKFFKPGTIWSIDIGVSSE